MNAKQSRRVYAHAMKLERKGKLKEFEVTPWAEKASAKNRAGRRAQGQVLQVHGRGRRVDESKYRIVGYEPERMAVWTVKRKNPVSSHLTRSRVGK
jgi:hypothetical protein